MSRFNAIWKHCKPPMAQPDWSKSDQWSKLNSDTVAVFAVLPRYPR